MCEFLDLLILLFIWIEQIKSTNQSKKIYCFVFEKLFTIPMVLKNHFDWFFTFDCCHLVSIWWHSQNDIFIRHFICFRMKCDSKFDCIVCNQTYWGCVFVWLVISTTEKGGSNKKITTLPTSCHFSECINYKTHFTSK